ncbi:DUF2341 domain-containing protein, partial [Candidatus Woesearchaeota archaeon]|nr:DUF2341 domain-containing protein [Candidatus Woesearchaeota archaeon]
QDGSTYEIRAYANDSFNNIGNYDVHTNIRIDRHGPVVNLDSPEDNANISNSSVIFYYNVTDATSSVYSCSLMIDDNINDTEYSIQEGQTQNFTEELTEGLHNWSINCTDLLGNVNSSEIRNFTVDTTGPVSVLDRPADLSIITGSSHTVNASVSDATGEVDTVIFEYRINSTDTWKSACNDTDRSEPFECSWGISGLTDGDEYEFRVHANDSFGNIGNYDIHHNITIDHNAPTIQLISPSDDYTDTDGDIQFSYQVNDVSIIRNCSLIINNIINQTNSSVQKGIDQYFHLNNIENGTRINWSINCTDYINLTNSTETRNLTVIILGNLIVDVTTNKTLYYEGEHTVITTNVTDELGFAVDVNVTTDIIKANTTMPWWNISWNSRKQINITNSGTTNLSNFPIYINISNEDGMQTDYEDLRFIDFSSSGYTELDYEIEYYDSNKADVWVEIPLFSTGINTIYMYYNNSAATTGENPASVWNDNYVGVWHLSESGSSPREDSTSYGNDGTNSGASMTTGVISGAQSFDGSSSMIEVDQTTDLEPSSSITLSAWIRRNGAQNTWAKVLWYGPNDDSPWGAYGFEFYDTSDSDVRWHIASSSTNADTTEITISDATWHHIVGTYNSSYLGYYIDGVLVDEVSFTGGIGDYDGIDGLGMGDKIDTGQEFTGDIDEVRISDVPRTLDWINMSYQIVSNQNSYVSTGGEEIFVNRSSGTTGSDGSFEWSWNTFSREYGNYSAVSLASSLSYNIGTDYAWFRITADTIYPTVVLGEPLNDSSQSPGYITFYYTPSDNADIANCSLIINNIINMTNSSVSNKQENNFTLYLNEGSYNWSINCTDISGNENSSETRILNIITTAPNSTLDKPENNEFITGTTYTVNATITGTEIDTATFEYRYNSTDTWKNACNDTDGSPFECSWGISGLADGNEYQVRVYANNTYGNRGNNDSHVNITIDNTPPGSFSLLTPSNNTISSDLTPLLNWSQTAENNFANYTIQVDNDPDFATIDYVYNIYDISTTQYQAASEWTTDTTWYWRVTAFDVLGLKYTAEYYVYETDTLPPVVTLVDPPDNDTDPDGNITFYYNANDANLSYCELYTNLSGWGIVDTDNNATNGLNSFEINNIGYNTTFIWNVRCVDSLGYSAFYSENWSVTITIGIPWQNITLPVNLSINNTSPVIELVNVNNPVNLKAGSTTRVNCSAVIRDDNGYEDIINASAVLYYIANESSDPDDNNTHYTNESCLCVQNDIMRKNCTCSFDIYYYALNGTWYCNVTAEDEAGLYGSGTNTTTINDLTALNITESWIDYGDIGTGQESYEQNVTITNLGNVMIDMNLFGYASLTPDSLAMGCQDGNISVEWERFSLNSGQDYNLMTALSNQSSPNQVDINIPKTTDGTASQAKLYWKLKAPPGVHGNCSGNIVFSAEIDS